MTPFDLFAAFETLADAPHGVKRLRELVLSLAIRGQLVSQDPREEPIAQMLRGRTIGVTNPPFTLPAGWSWSSIERLGDVLGGGTPSTSNPRFWDGGIPWVSPKDMKVPRLTDSEDHVSPNAVEGSSVKLIPPGSVLMVVRGMILAHSFPVAVTEVEVTVNQDMKALVPFSRELSEYLLLLLQGSRDRVLQLVERSTHGTCKLPYQALATLPLPLPPIAEQRRIVARVDELMSLIDGVEATRATCDKVRCAARDAALADLRDAPDAEAVEIAWERVSRRIDDLFTEPEDVLPLRRAVLQLAVRGRLVPQHAQDGTAEELLRDVAARRQRLGGSPSRGGEVLPPDAPWPLPPTWRWVRFGDLFECRLGKMLDAAKNTGTPRRYLRNANVRWGSYDLDDVLEMRLEDHELPDVSVSAGDLVICEGGEPGRCAVWTSSDTFVIQKALHRARPYGVNADFYQMHLRADCDSDRIATLFTGATIKHLTGRSLDVHPVALPPLAEQGRIVERVKALMDICDRLEARLSAACDLQAQFASAAVHHLDV